ncbi:MAG: hypothetical protein GY820_21015 [Gammaproteobacteria bacterium]|nr:hypothetical protein [Gammaproteobacteria bacterium]
MAKCIVTEWITTSSTMTRRVYDRTFNSVQFCMDCRCRAKSSLHNILAAMILCSEDIKHDISA